VLRITDAQGNSLLLSGDIEAEQEQRLVRGTPPLTSAGGAAPRQQDLIDARVHRRRAPQVAVVQAGYRNRFTPGSRSWRATPSVASRWCARLPVAPGNGRRRGGRAHCERDEAAPLDHRDRAGVVAASH
jgi:hypothetical protein